MSRIDVLFVYNGMTLEDRGNFSGDEIPEGNEMKQKCFDLSRVSYLDVNIYLAPDSIKLVPIYFDGVSEVEGVITSMVMSGGGLKSGSYSGGSLTMIGGCKSDGDCGVVSYSAGACNVAGTKVVRTKIAPICAVATGVCSSIVVEDVVNCDDGDECTTDGCSAGDCFNEIIADDYLCSSGFGVCLSGVCVRCEDNDDCEVGEFCATNDVCFNPLLFDCSVLNAEEGSYTLQNNVRSSGGSCFVINADSIYFNMGHNNVVGVGIGNGVEINSDSVVIWDAGVTNDDGGVGGISGFEYGIYISPSSSGDYLGNMRSCDNVGDADGEGRSIVNYGSVVFGNGHNFHSNKGIISSDDSWPIASDYSDCSV